MNRNIEPSSRSSRRQSIIGQSPSAAPRKKIRGQIPFPSKPERYSTDESNVLADIAKYGSAAVVAIHEGSLQAESFKERLEVEVAEAGGVISWQKAEGNIHGDEMDEPNAQVTNAAISEIRRKVKGIVVIGFEEVDYDAAPLSDEIVGTASVKKRIGDLIRDQRDFQKAYLGKAYECGRPLLEGLGFIGLGIGKPRHLRTHPEHYKHEEGAALRLLDGATAYALTVTGELTTLYDRKLY